MQRVLVRARRLCDAARVATDLKYVKDTRTGARALVFDGLYPGMEVALFRAPNPFPPSPSMEPGQMTTSFASAADSTYPNAASGILAKTSSFVQLRGTITTASGRPREPTLCPPRAWAEKPGIVAVLSNMVTIRCSTPPQSWPRPHILRGACTDALQLERGSTAPPEPSLTHVVRPRPPSPVRVGPTSPRL